MLNVGTTPIKSVGDCHDLTSWGASPKMIVLQSVEIGGRMALRRDLCLDQEPLFF